MAQRKFLNLVLLGLMVVSLFLGGVPVQAQPTNPPTGNPKIDQQSAMQAAMNKQPPPGKGNGQMRAMTQAERLAARLKQPAQAKGVSATYAGINPATAAHSPLATGAPTLAAMTGPSAPTDYFGVANWANSPLPTVGTAAPAPVYVGNPLVARANSTDFPPTPNVMVVVPSAVLPAGTLQSFQTFDMSTAVGSPTPSGGTSTAPSQFHAYVLRPTTTPNQYSIVADSGLLTVPLAATDGVQTFPMSGITPVNAGDVIGFYGVGIPVDVSGGTDVVSFPAPTTPPAAGTTITMGDPATYPLLPAGRIYSFGAQVVPAAATGTISGGMRKFVDGLPNLPIAVPDTASFPGSDYYEISLVQYTQQLHSDLPATKLRGYVQTNINPTTLPQYLGPVILATKGRPVRVKFTNALPGGGGATAVATVSNGGVSGIQITNGGTGYTTTPTVVIDPPSGCLAPATNCVPATATAAASGAVTNITVTNAGSGYTSAPMVTIIGADGDLFIPTDTTYMGAGEGPMCSNGREANAQGQCPAGSVRVDYLQDRGTLHLHGGNTPWISDGTPHQWTVPAGAATAYPKGVSTRSVPDMWFDQTTWAPIPSCAGSTTCLVANAGNDPGPGSMTFYWTNDQSGRMMFYHDHAYGITRLNVYAGEAAGYLVADPSAETQLKAATVPGTIVTDPAQVGPANPHGIVSADLAHMTPLVIQDKTFVPDDGSLPGSQLAATDPTWDVAHYGGKGSLWFPHVYMPNQNPADMSGANAFGRWDWGPWFWPPQDPTTLMLQPYACPSAGFNASTAMGPFYCPGVRNPSGVPEGFMDTPLVNGKAYPTLTVDPVAYRWQMLNAANDRTLNLGLYVADPLAVAVINGGAGYNPATPPAVTFSNGAIGTATVSTGQVSSILVTALGAGYTIVPAVTIDPPACPLNGTTCIRAAATAVIGGTGAVTAINVTNTGAGYTVVPNVVVDPPAGCSAGAPACVQATAQAQLTSAGSVLAITVSNPGASTTTNPTVTIAAPACTPGPTCVQASAIASANSEVKMVDAVPHANLCSATATSGAQLALATLDPGTGNPINGTGYGVGCWPTTWPTDGRDGGVPDPSTVGPPIIQIGTEGGMLPSPVVIPSTPTSYEYNRRSITVLNVFTHGLLIGPAERADAIVDFSQFAGKTLIVYNDAPAPVPAFDPRNDYYTGDPDQSTTGGAPSTLPGYGPNTRTIMQIKVNATATSPNVVPFSLPALSNATTGLPAIFASTQDKIIVPEPVYPQANGGGASNYVPIQGTAITAWLNSGVAVGSLKLTAGGSGYTAAPTVQFVPAAGNTNGTGAAATATLVPTSIAGVNLTNAGSGYSTVPNVTLSGGGGSASATATLAATGSVKTVIVSNGGKGYSTAPVVTFTAPSTIGGVRATGTAVMQGSRVASITITNAGSGYTTAPTISFGGPGTGAVATAILGKALASITVSGSGGYTSAPSVTIAAPTGCVTGGTPCTPASGQASLTGTAVATVVLTTGGSGYTSAPTVQFVVATGAPGSGAAATASPAPTTMIRKAIQELFTLDYGRMNATLGVELPLTNFLTQTTIPYAYVDPPTEMFKDGETQIWKITHNGVDTHFIHFHLFNVQVINRVGWDGAIKPPDANELSWKDTVRMNPLEDIIVALTPLKQKNLPWDLPNSVRRLDVTEPVGFQSTMSFTNVDPTNQPATVTNAVTNFGWEYVWHCHILGHEENDMMRAMVMAVAPKAASGLVAVRTGNGNSQAAQLSFTDNSLNETAWIVQGSINGGATWIPVATVQSNSGPQQSVGVTLSVSQPRGTTYIYRVLASNMVGYTQTYAAPAAGYPHESVESAASNTSGAVVTN